MRNGLALVIIGLVATACGSKGPPPRVAEVPIDEGSPPGRYVTPPPLTPSGQPAKAEVPGMPAGAGLENIGALAGALGAAGLPVGDGSLGGGIGGGAGGGVPVQLPAMKSVGAAGGSAAGGSDPASASGSGGGSKPVPSKAERLTAQDCNKIMDKYIELVGISQGISKEAIGGAMTMLRNSVSGDPNYANALGACTKENTKTQYKCAMKAEDVDGWKKCLQ